MSKCLRFCRTGLIMAVCGLGMIVFEGPGARAGNMQIVISEAGKTSITLDVTSPDVDPMSTDANHVSAIINTLNSDLSSKGYDFQFAGALGGNANAPGDPTSAFVAMSGSVLRTTTTGGDLKLTIDVTQNDFSNPPGPGRTLINGSSVTFTNTSAGSTTTTSFFNTSNALDDKTGTPTPPLIFNTNNGGQSMVPVSSVSPYSLTSEIMITLPNATVGTTGLISPQAGFSISATISSVPEPASIAMMGMGLPVVLVGLGWLRRRGAAA